MAFISRSLTPFERHYPVHKLEFLALKWAVVVKLHDYLYGTKFEVRTDNNPLTYMLTSAKLDATGHRWLAALSTYDFSLKYRSGVQNIYADALSSPTPNTNPKIRVERFLCSRVSKRCLFRVLLSCQLLRKKILALVKCGQL